MNCGTSGKVINASQSLLEILFYFILFYFILFYYILFYFIILYAQVFCLHACLCTTYVLGARRVQKRMLVSLEPELETVVSHHVGAVNQTQVLCKSCKQLLNCWATS
jgi:Flp pilus assembly protein TadB